jgi:hypothetical protein
MNSFASFGWELINLDGNGADSYFAVVNAMTLNVVNIDAALMVISPTSGAWTGILPSSGGWAEVLCQGKVVRGGPPSAFPGSNAAFLPVVASPDFGAASWYNPSNLNLIGDTVLNQDVFYSAILKTFVPPDGTGSPTHRQFSMMPGLALNAGDYLVFHMDHAGVSVDCEMQVVLGYTLA